MMMSRLDPFETLNREFERMFPKTVTPSNKPSYPPYNLIQYTPDYFAMEFAVAGFTKDQLDVTVEKNVLVIKGEQEEEAGDIPYLHKGIAARKFLRKFQLPEHMEVTDPKLENGILTIDLVKIVPEDEKPKRLEIK